MSTMLSLPLAKGEAQSLLRILIEVDAAKSPATNRIDELHQSVAPFLIERLRRLLAA
jgi:hypothetical protein